MADKQMESYVNCPSCGEPVQVIMESYGEEIGILKMLDDAMGIDNTLHYEGENKCVCGKNIGASLHVTSMEK